MLRGLFVLSLSLFLGQALGIGDIRLVTPENQRDVTFVRQGSSLELQCVVEGGDVDTTYPVAWYYNNVPLDTGTSDGTLVLDMENSVIEQGGWYTCAVSSNGRRVVLDFLVIFGGDPRIDVDVPTLYVVQGGSRVELPCFATGLPQPDVTWFDNFDRKIYDQQENGRYRIDPITQSLIIFSFTESLRQEMGPFHCVANNSFSNGSMQSFDVGISGEVTPAVLAPENFTLDPTQLHVEVNQNTAEQRLVCAGVNANHRYKWFQNGDKLDENTTVLTISRSVSGSGFYCCEIYRNTVSEPFFVVLNTHCTTVWFQTRAILREPTLPSNSHFYLPLRRKAALLCRGSTNIPSSVNNPKLHYGPPNITWSGPGENGKYIIDDFSDEQGLAYRLVEVQPETSGLYNCSGGNFVNLVEERTVTIQYVDNSRGGQTVIVNGLAEKNGSWSASGSASITTYRNEGVFMLSFPGSQSINNTWLMQDVIVPDGMQGVYISGRMRQSDRSDGPDGIYPVIQVFNAVDNVMKVDFEVPHPYRSSDAWQWVDKYVSTNGATNLRIRLALKVDPPKEQKRQTAGEEGSVFFDDISVIPSCENGLTFCTDSNECLESCDDSSDGNMLYIIVGGAGGGAVLLLLVAVVIIICCCCCCRKGKSGARPMKKMTTLIKKKASRRNQYKTNDPVTYTKNPDSPLPAEYEIPVQSELGVEYESIRGTYHSTNQKDGDNSEYTSLNPQSLNESTYYTTTDGSPYKKENNTKGGKAKQKSDEGGVEMYLEVRPSIPSQSSLADNSQLALTGLSGSGNKTSDIPSPDEDILDGDPLEYEYINADLGPRSK